MINTEWKFDLIYLMNLIVDEKKATEKELYFFLSRVLAASLDDSADEEDARDLARSIYEIALDDLKERKLYKNSQPPQ